MKINFKKKTVIIIFLIIFLFLGIGVFLITGETYERNKNLKEERKTIETAWNVFEEYLEANKEKDLEKVKLLSHAVSQSCLDFELIDECHIRMEGVVEATKNFEKTQFSEIWFDKKQIILFTIPEKLEEEDVVQYKKSYIYFSRNQSGEPKILAIDPGQVWSFFKGTGGYTEEEIEKELQSILIDTDKDGIPDIYELCTEPPEFCGEETRPDMRDTYRDGWWDGIRQFLDR